jgi:hypothetical protein
VLAQPVCASAAERNWSVYGQIKTTSRSRMAHAVGDKLVYCHDTLQPPPPEQAAEGWLQAAGGEVGSDSDESDDEKDLVQ